MEQLDLDNIFLLRGSNSSELTVLKNTEVNHLIQDHKNELSEQEDNFLNDVISQLVSTLLRNSINSKIHMSNNFYLNFQETVDKNTVKRYVNGHHLSLMKA